MTARKQPDVWIEIVDRAYPSGTLTTTRRSTRAMAYPTYIQGRVRNGSYSEIERALSDWRGNVEAAVFSWEEEDSDGDARVRAANLGATEYAHPEAVVKLLSEAGRKAGLTPRIIQRGYLSRPPQPAPNRKAKYESVDAIGSRFYRFDPEAPLQSQFIDKAHLVAAGIIDTPKDIVGKPYNIIINEHSDAGAATQCGAAGSAVKGIVPTDYVGRSTFPLGGLVASTSSIPPPVLTVSTVVGAGGTSTWYYAFTAVMNDGTETGMSNIAVVTGAPSTSQMSATNYVHLEFTPPTGWDAYYTANVAHFRVLGRTTNPPTTYLDAADTNGTFPSGWYDDGAHSATISGSKRDELDIEKPWTDTCCGTAIDTDAWGIIVVGLGAMELLGVYGSDVAQNATPARTLISPSDPDVITPLSPSWPHPNNYVDVNGIRLTLFYARGIKLQHHIDRTVTFAVNTCGVEDIGDGTGTPISEASKGLMWLLNEIVLNKYATGAYGTLATFSDGTSIIKTSAFVSYQATTVGFIGGRGYQMHLALTEKVTLSEVLQWWCQTFTSYIGVTEAGQITIHVVDITASATSGTHYRHKIEIDGPLPEAEEAEDEVENRAYYKYDFDPDLQEYRTERLKIEDLPSQIMYGVKDVDDDFLGLRCTRDATTAADSMGRRIRLNKVTPVYQPIPVGMIGFEESLGNLIRVTHEDGLGQAGYVNAPFFVVRMGLQLNGPQERVTLVARYVGNSLVTAVTGISQTVAPQNGSNAYVTALSAAVDSSTAMGISDVASVFVMGSSDIDASESLRVGSSESAIGNGTAAVIDSAGVVAGSEGTSITITAGGVTSVDTADSLAVTPSESVIVNGVAVVTDTDQVQTSEQASVPSTAAITQVPPLFVTRNFDRQLLSWHVATKEAPYYWVPRAGLRDAILTKNTTGGVASDLSLRVYPRGAAVTSTGTQYAALYKQFTSVPPFVSNTSMTLAGWFWMFAATGNGILMSYGASGDSSGIIFGVGSGTLDSSGGDVCCLLGNIAHVNTGVSYGGIGLHHYAMTLGGGDNLRVYVDGKKIYSGGGGATPSFSGSPELTVLGPGSSGGLSTRFSTSASIFELKLWGRTMTDGEIATLYREELPGLPFRRAAIVHP